MRALLLLALLLAPAAQAIGVRDAGSGELQGIATDLVERRVLLDLWDAGDAPRAFLLRLAPDSDSVPGLEARARPLHGPAGPWQPSQAFRLTANGDSKARDRGWDGLYELAVRARLPNEPHARLALLLVEEAPGSEALALTTHLRAQTLDLRAWIEPGRSGAELVARLEGAKVPSAVEATDGERVWSLGLQGEAWRAPAPDLDGEVSIVARFADGGALEGPVLRLAGGAPRGAKPSPPAPEAPSGPRELGSAAPALATGRAPPQEPWDAALPPQAVHGRAAPRLLPALPISLGLAALGGLALLMAPRDPKAFKRPPRI